MASPGGDFWNFFLAGRVQGAVVLAGGSARVWAAISRALGSLGGRQRCVGFEAYSGSLQLSYRCFVVAIAAPLAVTECD